VSKGARSSHSKAQVRDADGTMDDDAREVASFRAGPRARLHGGLVLASTFAGFLALLVAHAQRIDAWLLGEIASDGRPVYFPPHPVDPDAIDAIDFERLHGNAIPRWMILMEIAQSQAGRRRAERAYREVRSLVAPDANLLAIWDELHVRLADPIANARRIDWLLWAHDEYLEMLDQPFRLEATMHVRGERLVLRTLSYRVLADARAEGGERVRVLRRIDGTNVVEGWLGHTTREDEGALVVADRVLHFAVRHVWPSLEPALDERRDEGVRSLLPGVRREARAALSGRAYSVLAQTAEDQEVLGEVAASIRARRSCGSRFGSIELPYLGLSPSGHRLLSAALIRSRWSTCPDVTLDEAAQLVGASERLREADGVESALEELAAFVARAVAVHELRHVADGPSEDVECPGCEDGTPDLVRAELSAYFASFSTPGVGYVAALQACASPDHVTGLHPVAVALATGAEIPGGCGGSLEGVDLYASARRAERRFFGDRRAVGPPTTFPPALALFTRPAPLLAAGGGRAARSGAR
jgi:hypothetical protein